MRRAMNAAHFTVSVTDPAGAIRSKNLLRSFSNRTGCLSIRCESAAFDYASGGDNIPGCNHKLLHVTEWGCEQESLIRSPSPGASALFHRIGGCIAMGYFLALFEPGVLWRIWMCFAEKHEHTLGLDHLIETA
jgi:hypothetical protein